MTSSSPEQPNEWRPVSLPGVIGILALLMGIAWWLLPPRPHLAGDNAPRPLLIAPMMDLDPCMLAHRVSGHLPAPLQHCIDVGHSGQWVHDTLAPLQAPKGTTPFELGYTYKVPLLHLLKPRPDHSTWEPDPIAVRHVADTLQQTDFPTVLYLFSNHFAVGSPLETLLAQDPDNLAHGPHGPLAIEDYHGQPLYPWSIARTDNPLTRYRLRAMQALVEEICQRPPQAIDHLRAITLLGEVHHLFPGFEDGMGYDKPYLITDYSPPSMAAFQAATGHPPPTPDELSPHAHGLLAISGWVHDGRSPLGERAEVRLRLNGRTIATQRPTLSRQDVRAALPELRDAQVGYQFQLDLRPLPPGPHTLEVWLHTPGQRPVSLGRRSVYLHGPSDEDVRPHHIAEQRPIPHQPPPLPAHVRGWLDHPQPNQALRLHPLAEAWHQFRQQQVLNYIQHFAQALDGTCLEQVPRYTHQIFPHANPGWDTTRFGMDATLAPPAPLRLGVSLYGEASFGHSSFQNWRQGLDIQTYGITEYHPLQQYNPIELKSHWNSHHRSGALFLSFFLESRWDNHPVQPLKNIYSFDPRNPTYRSDTLYESVRTILNPIPIQTAP